MACDSQGRLYAIDGQRREILVFDTQGLFIAGYPVNTANGPATAVYGTLTIAGDDILLPVSSQGTVLRFGLDGRPKTALGVAGTLPGTLNFPVAVEKAGPDMFVVLGKSRFVVLCYDLGGTFLGEFGGKGYRAGWFYQPSLLAAPANDRVIVGQIFENTVQICRIPDFIRSRISHSSTTEGALEPTQLPAPGQGSLTLATTSSRRSPFPEMSASEQLIHHDGRHHLPVHITEFPSEESE